MLSSALEIVSIILLSSVKFLFAPGVAVASGYSFIETIIITVFGGVMGVLVFYYSGTAIFDWWGKRQKKNTEAKVFTRKNKLIVKTKAKFGLIGIAALLGFISVPIASFLAARYYGKEPRSVYYLIVSVVLWSLLLTTISITVKQAA